MSGTYQRLSVSSPGRICLFGEHQDYLHLPVIPCAISLRISVEASPRQDTMIRMDLPDVSSSESFSIGSARDYQSRRDYFRSGIKVLMDHGLTFSHGFDCTVKGKIPISAGVSS